MSEEKKDYKIKEFEWNSKDTFFFLDRNRMYTGQIKEVISLTCGNGAAQIKVRYCNGETVKFLYELFKTKEELFKELERLRDVA
jgi:hypothetical protein